MAVPDHCDDFWKMCLEWKAFSETGSFNGLPDTLKDIIVIFIKQ